MSWSASAAVVRRTGIGGIKLTGGDPALYGPLEEAVRRLRQEAGFDEIEVISRHPLIGGRAAGLAAAGVTQFNMSVDTLDPVLHHEICGVDDLPAVLDALGACVATGVPVKVNTVVMAGVNDQELVGLAAFCERIGVHTLKLLDVIKDLDAGAESFARRLAIKRGRAISDLYVPLDADCRAVLADRGQHRDSHPGRARPPHDRAHHAVRLRGGHQGQPSRGVVRRGVRRLPVLPLPRRADGAAADGRPAAPVLPAARGHHGAAGRRALATDDDTELAELVERAVETYASATFRQPTPAVPLAAVSAP